MKRGGPPPGHEAWPLLYNRMHGTTPLVVHAPGVIHLSPWWERIRAELLVLDREFRQPPSLGIITWNSGSPDRTLSVRGFTLGAFEESVARAGLECQVLGSGIGSAWTNRKKLELTIEYLAGSEDEFILAADSSDALLLGDPALILERFLAQPAKVLFNAESNFWPRSALKVRRFEHRVSRRPFRYLNSGAWIGRREDCLKAFQAARQWADRLSDWPSSDQVCWKYVHRELYPAVQVDWQCRIFQCLNRVGNQVTVRGQVLPREVLPPTKAQQRLRRLGRKLSRFAQPFLGRLGKEAGQQRPAPVPPVP